MSLYKNPNLNIKIVRSAARLMLLSGGGKECNHGIRAYRDLLLTTIRLRRRELAKRRPDIAYSPEQIRQFKQNILCEDQNG